MADCIVQNDGSSLILLNDGSSCILLNEQAPGVQIVGTHARPLIAARARQLFPVEFTFWITAGVLQKVEYRFRIIVILLKDAMINIKIKSSLLIPLKSHFHVKSSILRPLDDLTYKFEVKRKQLIMKLESKSTIKTIKKKLLESLLKDIKKDDE